VKLLVFGANSQLGQELIRLLTDTEIEFAALDTDQLDLLKPKEVVKAVSRINPTQLINVSTYSNLQKAESDPQAAKRCDLINTDGVTALARVCKQLNIPIIHHSSSYVFDGLKKETYDEEDEANPVCSYGKSKWYGERTLREEAEKHIILRTDWLFSAHRNKYFLNLIDSCKKNAGKISVVDNRFSPTHASDAARVILGIVKQVDCNAEVWGTYHYNAMQAVNQDQFVLHVLEEAAKLDAVLDKILPSLEMELLLVERPYIRNSALNASKIMGTFGIKQHSRGAGITAVLEEIYGVKKEKPPVQGSSAATTGDHERQARTTTRAKRKKTSTKKPSQSKLPAKKAVKQK